MIGDGLGERQVGAAFVDEEDVLNPDAQHIGVAYQISSFGPIDPCTETFDCQLQLTMLFQIANEDHEAYEVAMLNSGTEYLQEMFDKRTVRRPPPVFEILNAQAFEVLGARVTFVRRMYVAESGTWEWFAQLFFEFKAHCYEALEYHDFPFSRQMFQVKLGLKTPQTMQALRPFNDVLPRWQLMTSNGAREAVRCKLRPNLFKHTTELIGCWRLKSHSIDFVPLRLTPRMASGQTFSVCSIALFMQQSPDYFVWNSFVRCCVSIPCDLFWDCARPACVCLFRRPPAHQIETS